MTAKVSIAMFGSSLVSAYWNGAATYYRGIIRALDECGFDVTFYEPDQARRIGDRARRRLLAEHTYQHRAQELKKLLVDQMTVGALGARPGEEKHRAAL